MTRKVHFATFYNTEVVPLTILILQSQWSLDAPGRGALRVGVWSGGFCSPWVEDHALQYRCSGVSSWKCPVLFGTQTPGGGWVAWTEDSPSYLHENFILIPLWLTAKYFAVLTLAHSYFCGCLPYNVWLAYLTPRAVLLKEIYDLLFLLKQVLFRVGLKEISLCL